MNFKTNCTHVFFVSSSGHCSLDCNYCLVTPVAKHEPSLNYDDIAFLVDRIDGRPLLLFSGKGDFFAGYKKQERLLEKILALDVEVGLDINGVIIHEFAELSEEALEKIRFINLTLHYRQLLDTNALKAWKENALTLISRKGGENFLAGLILSPGESQYWHDALTFYEDSIFSTTRQPLVLIKDTHAGFGPKTEDRIISIERDFAHMVEEVFQEDFSARFGAFSHVLCPAGSTCFRIWNDGLVQGCPYIPELANSGNLKDRRFSPRTELFACTEARYCDCNNIALAGKMCYPPVETPPPIRRSTFWLVTADKLREIWPLRRSNRPGQDDD